MSNIGIIRSEIGVGMRASDFVSSSGAPPPALRRDAAPPIAPRPERQVPPALQPAAARQAPPPHQPAEALPAPRTWAALALNVTEEHVGRQPVMDVRLPANVVGLRSTNIEAAGQRNAVPKAQQHAIIAQTAGPSTQPQAARPGGTSACLHKVAAAPSMGGG